MADERKNPYSIDKDALDEEWLEQPQLMFQVSTDHAQARREVQILNTRQTALKAKVRRKLLRQARDAGERIAETTLKELVNSDSDVLAGEEAICEAEDQVNMSAAHIAAATDKRRALEALVDLYKVGYFNSNPTERPTTDRRVGSRK